MIKINPSIVLRFIVSLQVLIEKAIQVPLPEKISARITSTRK